MTYEEAKEYLLQIEKSSGMQLGLSAMEKMLERLGHPEEKLKIVHVAGTNGKGSVMAFLSSILVNAGYRVGRYSSPAVFDIRDSFLISEKKQETQPVRQSLNSKGESEEKEEPVFSLAAKRIRKEEYAGLTAEIRETVNQMEMENEPLPTRFEMETVMAFLYFLRKKCDLVLLEAGLGGDLDATNVIKSPVCSVITSISFDHCGLLGNTIEEIAGHKAGIIKRGCPVVSYDQEVSGKNVKKVISDTAEKMESPLVFADFSLILGKGFQSGEKIREYFSYREYQNLCICLPGENQKKNAVTAVEAAEVLRKNGFVISEEAVRTGLYETRWPGRFEMIQKSPVVVIDGAHNPDAAKALSDSINRYFKDKKIIFVMGVFADKEYSKIVANTVSLAEKVYCVTTHTRRALPAEELVKEVERQGGYAVKAELSDALQRAASDAGKDGVVVAFGSLSFLKDIAEASLLAGKRMNGNEASKKSISAGNDMERVNRIWANQEYQKFFALLEEKERNRIYCKHGKEHIFSVARLAWITILENGYRNISKDVVYALAFLHDLGRYQDSPGHALESAELAGRILPECGFSEEEKNQIIYAIRMHGKIDKKTLSYGNMESILKHVEEQSAKEWIERKRSRYENESARILSAVLLKADHDSRDCFCCPQTDSCYWNSERKVNRIPG